MYVGILHGLVAGIYKIGLNNKGTNYPSFLGEYGGLHGHPLLQEGTPIFSSQCGPREPKRANGFPQQRFK